MLFNSSLQLLVLQILLGTSAWCAFTLNNLPSPLSPPTGMRLKWLVLGSGTQNYVCPGNSWVLESAEATLKYKATSQSPKGRKGRNTRKESRTIGRHYFEHSQPTFELSGLGKIGVAKTAAAPDPFKKGVAWLQLDVVSGKIAKRVYRTSTSGGVPPKTPCNAESHLLKVPYSAVYSFWD